MRVLSEVKTGILPHLKPTTAGLWPRSKAFLAVERPSGATLTFLTRSASQSAPQLVVHEWERTMAAAKELGTVMRDINMFRAVDPTNRDSERRRFLESDSSNPSFEYAPIDAEARRRIEAGLDRIDVPKTPLGDIVARQIESARATLVVASKAGHAVAVRRATEAIFGRPSPALVAAAITILERVPESVDTSERLTSEAAKSAFEETIASYHLEGWTVGLEPVSSTNVDPKTKTVTVAANRSISRATIERLCAHEIGVHVLRGANGERQPLETMKTGLAGYESTEEGLAVFMELATGNLDNNTLRKYAARVVAIDSVLKNESFRDTFDRLRGYDFSQAQAWTTALRVHRGGGYIQDHIYLEGLLDVVRYRRDGGDIPLLFAGKIRTEDAPLTRSLIDAGFFVEPSVLPHGLDTLEPERQPLYALLESLARTVTPPEQNASPVTRVAIRRDGRRKSPV